MPSDASKRAAEAVMLWIREHRDEMKILPELVNGVAALIDAEFSREPARLQSREAIEGAIYKASNAIDAAYVTGRTYVLPAIVGAAITFQPCGHLVTSQVDREGKLVCEQCEFEAEIIEALDGIVIAGTVNDPLVWQSAADVVYKVLAKLRRKNGP